MLQTKAYLLWDIIEADLFGVHARIFRISFSGELAYEVNVESDNGNFMWEKIMEVGQEFKIQPYGTEALSTLRIEMGTLQDQNLMAEPFLMITL